MFSLLLHVDCKNRKIYGKSLLAVKCFILHDIFSAKLKMTLNSQLKFVSTYYSLQHVHLTWPSSGTTEK